MYVCAAAGEAGSDIAVILAGYKQDMFDMLDNNPVRQKSPTRLNLT